MVAPWHRQGHIFYLLLICSSGIGHRGRRLKMQWCPSSPPCLSYQVTGIHTLGLSEQLQISESSSEVVCLSRSFHRALGISCQGQARAAVVLKVERELGLGAINRGEQEEPHLWLWGCMSNEEVSMPLSFILFAPMSFCHLPKAVMASYNLNNNNNNNQTKPKQEI